MFNFRDFVLFIAGAQFFHTLSHLFLQYAVVLPLQTSFLVLTPELNSWAIGINAAVTVALLWWATRLKK